ncbi:MAG: DUF4249 domain-containing protein [Bacteroidales bacterium]|nr:DUF4249 domain-containing protein [Bacteroidales bacterium]
MKKALLILLVMALAACSRDGADVPEKLVVEGWIEEGRAPVVYVTTSLVPKEEPESLEDIGSHIVKWAKVTISDGEEEVILTGTASKRFYPPYAYTTGRMVGKAGKTYRLTVDYGGVHAEATATVLPSRPLSSIETVKQANGRYIIRAAFPDTDGCCRFFHRIEKVDSTFIPSPLAYTDGSVREAIIRPGKSIARADDHAGGFASGERVRLKFCTMDNGMYRFWQAFEEQAYLADVPVFTLDGNIPGNVSGDRAIGYFAGYGCTEYSVEIP